MSNEIEYVEPTQEHVGQMVEVRDQTWRDWKLVTLDGVIAHEFKFVAHELGGIPVGWRHARIPRPLTYAERQAKCGLRVGDRVRFTRKWSKGELGVHLEFMDEMQCDVGNIGTVVCIQKSIRVEFSEVAWWLPCFVLEKVEDRRATNRDHGKTVYVDGNPGDEFTIEMTYQVGCEPFRAVVRSGDKRFVYELSNLRVKE